MKILKVIAQKDHPERYNYQVNHGVWEYIKGDYVILENFNINLDNYDIVLLPMYSRCIKFIDIINRIKDHKIKSILFDNDSCFRLFTDDFYKGFDYIHYRDVDKSGKIPEISSSRHLWSVDTNLFTPKFGGNGISFNCSVSSTYDLRRKIIKYINATNYKGKEYITHLQNSSAAIHTNSEILPYVRAKILEFAACGCQILSNISTTNMNLYFPEDMIIWFNDEIDLQYIIQNFKPNVNIQRKLREIVEYKHSHEIRANEILKILNSL